LCPFGATGSSSDQMPPPGRGAARPPPPMTAHFLRQDFPSGAEKKPAPRVDLQESIAHLHPLHRQHAIELHRQHAIELHRQHAIERQAASSFAARAVPASCGARSRFLNLRDSVKKSPAKAAGRPQHPWVPFAFSKVPRRRRRV